MVGKENYDVFKFKTLPDEDLKSRSFHHSGKKLGNNRKRELISEIFEVVGDRRGFIALISRSSWGPGINTLGMFEYGPKNRWQVRRPSFLIRTTIPLYQSITNIWLTQLMKRRLSPVDISVMRAYDGRGTASKLTALRVLENVTKTLRLSVTTWRWYRLPAV